MNKRFVYFVYAAIFLLLRCACAAAVSNAGEVIQIEGFVESAGLNTLRVAGKTLTANAYSSIDSGGTNIIAGDYVEASVYLNTDLETYTIIRIRKDPERSAGSAAPVWEGTGTDLRENIPDQTSERAEIARSDDPVPLNPEINAVPSRSASAAFEGVVTAVRAGSIQVGGIEYSTDSATGYKNGRSVFEVGDYVRGRAEVYAGARLIRYIEGLEDYERPDLETAAAWGLCRSQDAGKIAVSTPSGDLEGLFYPGTKLSAPSYTRGTLVRMEMAGPYVKSVSDFRLVQSGSSLSPFSGTVDEIIRFSEDEIYFISSGLAYFMNGDVQYLPDRGGFEKGAAFAGLMKNGRVVLLFFTADNHVRAVNGTVAAVEPKLDGSGIDFEMGGSVYHILPESVVTGTNLVRHSVVNGYADGAGNVFYLSFATPWYARFKDWNWRVIAPAALSLIGLILFLLLHRTKTEGYLQEVNGDLLILTDGRGEHKRYFRCTEEIARYAPSLVTMKVELTVYRGSVIHIRYDL